MIERTDRWEAFEQGWRRRSTSHARNLRVYEALWREARALGRLPREDPLDGIEDDVRRIRRLRRAQRLVRAPTGEDRAGA